MTVTRIESLEDSRLDPYRSLRKTNANRFTNLFVAEGVTVVQRLLNSDFEVHSVLVTDSKAEQIRSTVSPDVPVYQLSKELATMLVGYTFHMGVLAAGVRRPQLQLESVLPREGPSLVFFADRVIDQQNVGLLIRIASGFGASALVLANGSADPFSRRAIRVSMGNGLALPVVETPDTITSLRRLRSLGYTNCATVLSENAVELNTYSFPARSVVIFGNETHGIAETAVKECQQHLTVSMCNTTDSLNVAIAAGVFGYAYRCQFANDLPMESQDVRLR